MDVDEASPVGWSTAWAPEESTPIEYRYVSAADQEFAPGLRDYFQYRDLGLAAASGGALTAQHIRRVGTGTAESDWHCHDLDFQLFVVLRGTIDLEIETGEQITLGSRGAGYQPPFLRNREKVSDDYEVLEITTPATV